MSSWRGRPERPERGSEQLPAHMRYMADELDEAQAELAKNPAVRATMRLQDECPEPNVTFRLVDQTDMTDLRRIEDAEGFGHFVRDNGPSSCTRCGRPAGGEWVDEAGAPRCPACQIEESRARL